MASKEIYRHKKYDYESYRGPPRAKISIYPEYLRFRKSEPETEPKPKRFRKSALDRAVPLDLGNLLKGVVIWFLRSLFSSSLFSNTLFIT